MSLEQLMAVEVVSGASKYDQRVAQAPASITIVSSEDLRLQGYQTLGEALQGIRGFYVNYDRNYDYVGVRGFAVPGDYNSRVLLLIDGHRLNENIFGSMSAGTDGPLDLEFVHRIEIIRGPSSSVYGTNAFFAVINIVTKSAEEMPRSAASAETGSYGSYRGTLRLSSWRPQKWDVSAGWSRRTSDGPTLRIPEYSSDPATGGVAANADEDAVTRLFVSARRGSTRIQGAFVDRRKGIGTGAWGTIYGDPRSGTLDRRAYLSIDHARPLSRLATLTGRLSWDRYRYEGQYVYDAPPATKNREAAEGRWLTGEAMLAIAGGGGNIAQLGVEARNNVLQGQEVHDAEPFVPYFDFAHNSVEWGSYLQIDRSLGPDLRVSAGLRYDRNEAFGGTWNPRLAAIQRLAGIGSVKLLYGRAFRAPNDWELHFESYNQKTPSRLEPERVRTLEAVWERSIGKRIRLSASAFQNRISDLILLAEDPADSLLVFGNSGLVRARGIEAEVQGRWESGLAFRASLSSQSARDEATDASIPNSPVRLGAIQIVTPTIWDAVRGALEVHASSSRKTLAGGESPAFAVANATITLGREVRGLRATLSCRNLLDADYGLPGGTEHIQDLISQDGRTVRAEIGGAW